MDATRRNSSDAVGAVEKTRAPGRAMNRLAKLFVLFVSLIWLGAWGGNANAAARFSVASGNWNTTTTWGTACGGAGGSSVPGTADTATICAGTAVAINATTRVNTLTIDAGATLNASTFQLRVNTTTSVSGAINFTGTVNAQHRFSNAVTINAGGAWTDTSSSTFNFRAGGITNNGGTFSGGTGVYEIRSAAQAIGGTSPISIPSLLATTTITNTGVLTVGTALTGSTLVNSAASTLNLGGTSTITTLTATAAGNTVNYTGAAQTVKATPYSNLGLGGSGAKTMTGVTTIGGNMTMSGTATATAAAALTVGGNFSIGATNTFANGANALNVAGNFVQNGTFTAGTGVVTLNGGAAVQTISGTGPLGFANLTVNNTGGITLARNVTVTSAIIGAVTLTSTCPTNYTLTSSGGATVANSCPAPAVSSINLASVNPTNPNTSVDWTVTFSQSVTGVDATDFLLVPGGSVTGAAITGVAGSGTTWTVTANTGSGAGSLGLSLVDDDTIVAGAVKLGGTGAGNGNFTGQVYTVEATMTCITDNFSSGVGAPDTSLWDVRTILGPFLPQVINAGGGDFRLRLTDTGNNEATFAQLKRTFPGAGNKIVVEIDYFAYGGSGADGIAVTFSDSAISSTTGGFGGSLGYAQNGTNDGFGGGWLGIGLDEYGNFPNPTEGRTGYPAGWVAPAPANVAAGFYKTNVSIRGSGSAQTGYRLLANTGLLATPVAPASGAAGATPYRYRLTIDHSNGVNAWVTVERDTTATGTSYQVLVPTFDVKAANSGQAAVPENWLLSFTGSTGGATNFHEFKQVRVCANTIVASNLHHVAIDAPAAAATLTDVPVIIEPHDVADTPLGDGSTINLSTSTGAGDWTIGTGTGTLTPGAADSGLATYTFGPGETSVTLDFSYYTAGLVTINVADAGGGDLLLNTPVGEKANTIDFTASSFVFTDSACVHNIAFGAPGQTCTILNWSPQVAGQDVQNVYITMVDGAGVPSRLHRNRDRTRNMRFGLSCHDPVAHAGIQATFDAVTLPLCEANGAIPTAWSATLASVFPGGIPSAGPYIFNYADVGAVNLWMQNSASPGQVGASGTFVVKPGGFVLSGIMRTSDSFANPAAANAAGTKFVKAGEMFSVTVTATTCTPASATCTVAGVATPNYGNETAAEGVMLASTLVAPVGGSNPAVGGTFGAFTNGVATGAAFIWDEVGIINLTPGVGDGDYLGLGDVTGTASGNVGRFYPHHFDTAVTATATTPMPCPTGLTCPTLYDGFIYSGQPFSVQVFARNLGGNTTANYDGTLGFSKGTTLTAWDALGGTTQNPGSGVLGSNTVVAAAFGSGAATLTDTPAYTFGTSPTAPTDIYVRADDTDGVTSLRAISVEGGIKVVSGRILVPNAYGSNLLPLPLTVTAQYYTASGWITSVTDSVTSVTVAANYDVVKNGSPIGTTAPAPTGVATLNSGQRTIVLGKPTGNASGVATISPGAPTYLPVIPGTATFGIYKGNNEFIYLRESY